MRVLPIGLAIVRGSGVLLVGIGLRVVVFASRQVNPWPKARVGAAIAAIGCRRVPCRPNCLAAIPAVPFLRERLEGAHLIFECQERRPEQVLVRVVQRDPPFELGPAPTDSDQPIATHGRRPGVSLARAGARTMGQDEASDFSVDAHRLVSCRVVRRG